MSFIDNDVTDLFCGCGGSSQGARKVRGVNVKYAMNHWRLAVDSHNENHPDTHHDCADISETHPGRYDRTSILIGSPECTNHSLAKGKRRKNLNQGDFFKQNIIDPSAVRSRATMWDIVRFAEVHMYDNIIVENVVDVRDWILFDAWLKAMHNLGYKHKCVYLNAQFAHGDMIHGFAPQSRDRIYIVFWKKGNPEPDLEIRPKAPCVRCGEVEAVQAWKPGRKAGKYKTQYLYRCPSCSNVVTPYYYAAINAFDLSLPMIRIGDRENLGMRPLSANTMARIEYGLKKFGLRPTVLDLRNQSGNVSARIKTAEFDPLNAQTTGFSSYLFAPFMFNMSHTHSKSDYTYGMNGVFPTQTTQESMGLVTPFLMANRKNATPKGFEDIIPSVVGRGSDMFMVAPPAAMLTMRGGRSLDGLTDPMPTQVAARIQNWLVGSQPMMLPYYGKPQAHTLTDTLPTVRTKESHAFVETNGQPKVEDCYFRMMETSETAKAQGFPDDYIILGNKEQRQKQIGNANPPPTMQLLVQRCVESLRRQAWV